MRPLDDWQEADLISLVTDEVQEGLRLDYKRSDALNKTDKCKAEIAKDVSAFANSAGGRIIYGIIEKGHLPERVDEGSDPAVISREWIEQVINSRIQPRIAGIRIKPITLSNKMSAYVIDIPQATFFAPHQTDNHRYYRRFNFQSVPMEDYEIKDAMRRSTVGDPHIWFRWTPIPVVADEVLKGRLSVLAGNRASEPIMYSLIKVFIDSRIFPSETTVSGWTLNTDVYSFSDGNLKFPLTAMTRTLTPVMSMPFFKETEWLIAEIDMAVPPAGLYHISYHFVAPGIDRRLGGSFHFEGFQVKAAEESFAEMLTSGLALA